MGDAWLLREVRGERGEGEGRERNRRLLFSTKDTQGILFLQVYYEYKKGLSIIVDGFGYQCLSSLYTKLLGLAVSWWRVHPAEEVRGRGRSGPRRICFGDVLIRSCAYSGVIRGYGAGSVVGVGMKAGYELGNTNKQRAVRGSWTDGWTARGFTDGVYMMRWIDGIYA